jgi:hypothetical protein
VEIACAEDSTWEPKSESDTSFVVLLQAVDLGSVTPHGGAGGHKNVQNLSGASSQKEGEGAPLYLEDNFRIVINRVETRIQANLNQIYYKYLDY